jgi:hypothetical protein
MVMEQHDRFVRWSGPNPPKVTVGLVRAKSGLSLVTLRSKRVVQLTKVDRFRFSSEQ